MFKFFAALSFLVCLLVNDNAITHPSSDDLANLVSKLSPSVVNVFTIQKPKEQQNLNQLPFDNIPPQFRDFFKILPRVSFDLHNSKDQTPTTE